MEIKYSPSNFLQKKFYPFILFGSALLSFASLSYSNERYFICGGDEMGCEEGFYQYCICIPYNEVDANSPYCLDFDIFTCTPLSQNTSCAPMFTFKNQNECLATIFHSEPSIPCSITTKDFCLQEHTVMCDANGQLDSCHYPDETS